MNEPTKKPPSNLTLEQQERLKKLQASIQFDKLTVSFSIEDRDQSGRKKSAFYSVTASRGTGAEIPTMGEDKQPTGFATEDVKIVRSLLSKHVVVATYEDAMHRGVLQRGVAIEELRAILSSYDRGIERMLTGNGNGEGESEAR